MNKKIYFAGSIRGGRVDAELYNRIITCLGRNDKVLTEHVGKTTLKESASDREIYERDMGWLRESDIVIAECTCPSLGVGYELACAKALGKPVHIFYNRTKTSLSAMLTGDAYYAVHPYEHENDIYPALDDILASNASIAHTSSDDKRASVQSSAGSNRQEASVPYVRRAGEQDIEGIMRLLVQVNMVHHNGRPDLFNGPTTKYSESELADILQNENAPVFVCVKKNDDENADIPVNGDGEAVLGHAFCIMQEHTGERMIPDMKTLYIDDICVEEHARGLHVGTRLYQHAEEFARISGCYNVTLNVWECNPGARAFYEAMGMSVQKTGMEKVLRSDE